MAWCTQVLGIHTTLEIKEFEYYDYLQARMNQMDDSEDEMCDNDDDDEITTTTPTVHDYPTISVRGLAATRDIEPGVSYAMNVMCIYGAVCIHVPGICMHIDTLSSAHPLLSSGRGHFDTLSCHDFGTHHD